jgi:hypothetical protein
MRIREEIFCGEWLPYLNLSAMRLYAPEGHVVNPNTQYRTLYQEGVQLKDVVHWSWTTRGNLKVTALTKTINRSVRRQIGHLVQLLVLNFPQLLRGRPPDERVRYFSAATDHIPLGCTLDADRCIYRSPKEQRGAKGSTKVHTHRELTQYLCRAVGEPLTIHRVTPALLGRSAYGRDTADGIYHARLSRP